MGWQTDSPAIYTHITQYTMVLILWLLVSIPIHWDYSVWCIWEMCKHTLINVLLPSFPIINITSQEGAWCCRLHYWRIYDFHPTLDPMNRTQLPRNHLFISPNLKNSLAVSWMVFKPSSLLLRCAIGLTGWPQFEFLAFLAAYKVATLVSARPGRRKWILIWIPERAFLSIRLIFT